MDGRPLDVLEAAVDAEVVVRLKGGDALAGTLAGYDQHMNLVLAAPEGADGTRPDDGAAHEDGDELDDGAATDAATVDNTTVIRGDNVVTIET